MDSNTKNDVVLEEMCVEQGTDSDDEEDSEEEIAESDSIVGLWLFNFICNYSVKWAHLRDF